MQTLLARIVAPHFVAGIELNLNGGLHRCAPIVAYMRDWPPRRIKTYCDRKRWSIARVDRHPVES